jgi:hypothetical protein
MKTSNFLNSSAIYGFIGGGMMLFNTTGSLQNYGVQPIDQYHIVILQYLRVVNIGLSLVFLLSRNSNDPLAIRNILLPAALLNISSFLKACYDIFLLNVPSNTFFGVDMSFRLLVGFACLHFAFKKEEQYSIS